MKLKDLIEEIEYISVSGNTDIEINKIEYSSKKIENNDIFFAIKGYKDDGEKYIGEAINKGAKVIFVEGKIISELVNDITYIIVENIRITMSLLAAKYYNFPAKQLKLIGITGTKGKTTTAFMIRDILLASGKKTGMIGTVSITYADVTITSERTCPESLDLHRLFKDMVDKEIEYVVMEVSSHALELNRVNGLQFAVSAFTNLSEEHLDFHKDMEEYLKAKSKLFKLSDFALINGDDIYSNSLLKLIDCKYAKFGIDNEVNLSASDIRINSGYVEFKMYVNKMLETIHINIPGRFTVYNALAAIGVTSMLNCQMDAILLALANVKVPGRSEIVDIGKTFTVMVDYAHNPSSLEAILISTKKYVKGRIILVFGCGGDRDTFKRSVMGEIAGKYANFTVITTDNSRSELPRKIMVMIENGMKKTSGLYKIIEDRKLAIAFAMKIAWTNDMIIVAGKGHETYQIIGDKKIFFDDKEVIKTIASEMQDKNFEA